MTFAQYTNRLDELLWFLNYYQETEAEKLMQSQQTCFSPQSRDRFYANYIKLRDVTIPQTQKEYEELHDQFMTKFAIERET